MSFEEAKSLKRLGKRPTDQSERLSTLGLNFPSFGHGRKQLKGLKGGTQGFSGLGERQGLKDLEEELKGKEDAERQAQIEEGEGSA
ncbi:hypothetical protein R1flu_005949 [Riccia fluitans]|uniref:Uncharacterized protein n=1 Tax=Riccia fluitans TaxID=41844 RepID=A0ABD1YUV8_9MARC